MKNKKSVRIAKMGTALIVAVIIAIFVGCACFNVSPGQIADFGFNKQLIDPTYEFNRGIVKLPNGQIVEGKVQSWTDFEDGDQIQVKIDGKTYLAHSANVVLIDE